MKLPKLPAPMTAKFVYPDMSEMKYQLSVRVMGPSTLLLLLFMLFANHGCPILSGYVRAMSIMSIIRFFPSH